MLFRGLREGDEFILKSSICTNTYVEYEVGPEKVYLYKKVGHNIFNREEFRALNLTTNEVIFVSDDTEVLKIEGGN